MNDEVASLYQADRQERVNQPKVNTPAYHAMRTRDLQRRQRIMEIVAANELQTAEDYFHAAWILNHGDISEDVQYAHALALRASELGYRPARRARACAFCTSSDISP